MTPAQRKQANKTSVQNFKRMKFGRQRRLGKLLTEFTHKQIDDATDEFLNSGGKIDKCDVISGSSFNIGQPEVDNFLMGV